MKRLSTPKPVAWVAVCLLLLGWAVTVTFLWVAQVAPLSADWGTVADWFTGVVTLLALVAAVWAGRAAYGQLQVMRSESEERSRESRERQARLITLTEDVDVRGRFVGVVHNRSDEPVTKAALIFHGPNNENTIPMGLIPPLSNTVVEPTAELVERARQILLDQIPEDFRDMLAGLIRFNYSVLFTDARGVQWQRMPDASLIERSGDFDSADALREVVALVNYHSV